jgi:hypothetical protein
MKILNLAIFVCLLSSVGYANSHTLKPGQTALIQKRDGSWIEIKTKEKASLSGFFSSTFNCIAAGALAGVAYYFAKSSIHSNQFESGIKAIRELAQTALFEELDPSIL